MGDPVIRTASDVPIKDVGGFFTSDEVEGALQELGASGGGGGNATFAEVENTVTSDGQTTFPALPAAIVAVGGLAILHVNGIVYARDTDYTVSGTTLTWLDNLFTLKIGDAVTLTYQTT